MSTPTILRPPVAGALRDTVPVALSIAPLGLVVGAAGASLGIPPLPGAAAAVAVFGGSAHVAALGLVAAGAGALTVVGAAALVHARLLIYAAALEPWFRDQPAWLRWTGPALLIDQTYLMVLARADLDDPRRFRRYWLAAGIGLACSWAAVVAAGAVLGPLLPPGSPLDAAGAVVVAGMLAPRLTAPRPLVVAVVALGVAVLGAALPGGVGLAAGIVAGVLTGALLDRVRP